MAAIDESVPAPVLSAALYERFGSRGEADFAVSLPGVGRFRLNAFRERGHFALAVRTVRATSLIHSTSECAPTP